MTLTPDELNRYARHLSLDNFGLTAQASLKQSRILVVGAGGLGCPALLYLAAAGVGTIDIMDADTIDVSNLQRQILFNTASVGQLKAVVAAEKLKQLNPHIHINVYCERLTAHNALERIAPCDVVLDGCDNFETRYLVNDACLILNKPFVYGAIHTFSGQVGVFNWKNSASYRCLFPEPDSETSIDSKGGLPNCMEAGVLGVLPGLIGTLQATEVIKLLSGVGDVLSNQVLLWDALNTKTQRIKLIPNPDRFTLAQHFFKRRLFNLNTQCDNIPKNNLTNNPTMIISPQSLKDILKNRQTTDAIQLIDVRQSWERDLGTLNGSVHLPLNQLQTLINEDVEGKTLLTLFNTLHINPTLRTVVFCAAGIRSQTACTLLQNHAGFKDIYSLEGGYQAWH